MVKYRAYLYKQLKKKDRGVVLFFEVNKSGYTITLNENIILKRGSTNNAFKAFGEVMYSFYLSGYKLEKFEEASIGDKMGSETE